MPTTIHFSGLSLELPDRWFEAKTRGADIRTFLRFFDPKCKALEPVDLIDRKTYPRDSFTTLTFVYEMGVKPRYLSRRLASRRKGSMDYGSDTRTTPNELRQFCDREWTCWEVTIPPRFYDHEFTACHGYALVGKPEDPEPILWGLLAMGPSSLAATVRESFSFALSRASFQRY